MPYNKIGIIYGCSGNNIKKVARKLGIELEHRRKINESETFNKGIGKFETCLCCGKKYRPYRSVGTKFCSTKCQSLYEYNEYINRWKNGLETGIRGKCDISNHIRRYLFEKYNCSCEICGWGNQQLN